ncbi:hypothetical protein K2173_013582 [Erythroxylum novogranatense]|uniref:Uncharacterized protein n=1 Tax=Erythroxylum novogranatense TaxID=1862640 RepID=A0AAV8TJY0_9ROSI|nr:hypothetical protein K2173_013582 [Erythroxylum novogranatense]
MEACPSSVAESVDLDVCFDDVTRPKLQYVTEVKARQEDVLHIFRTPVQPSSEDKERTD